MSRTYKIFACSKYGREEIDTAGTDTEAAYLVREYALAYGKEFAMYALNRQEQKELND